MNLNDQPEKRRRRKKRRSRYTNFTINKNVVAIVTLVCAAILIYVTVMFMQYGKTSKQNYDNNSVSIQK